MINVVVHLICSHMKTAVLYNISFFLCVFFFLYCIQAEMFAGLIMKGNTCSLFLFHQFTFPLIKRVESFKNYRS